MTYPKKLSPKLKKSLQGSAYLLSYYLANKQILHIRSQDLEISTLIREIKITHHCHYDKNRPKIPLCLTKYSPPRHYKEINPTTVIMIKIDPKYHCD